MITGRCSTGVDGVVIDPRGDPFARLLPSPDEESNRFVGADGAGGADVTNQFPEGFLFRIPFDSRFRLAEGGRLRPPNRRPYR